MRIGIQVVGSEGDIRPLIALAAGLRASSHHVTVAVHGTKPYDFGELCRRWDVDYVAPAYCPALDSERLSSTEGGAWAIELFQQFWRAGGNEDIIYDVGVALCERHDLIISHYLSYPTKAAALKTGASHVAVQLTHEHTPTAHEPPRARLPNLGDRLNPIMWDVVEEMIDTKTRRLIDPFWERRSLPRVRRITDLYFSDSLNLIAVSPVLCPPQPDWRGLHVVTGPMELPATEQDDWSPPSELQAFLDAGSPPLFMAFGSTQEIYPGSTVERNMGLMIDAAVQAGCRAVIQSPAQVAERYPPNSQSSLSERVFFVGRVPYERMFSLSAAIVHHGGAGTSHLAMRQGRPSVIVPFTEHHWFIGCAMHRIGAAAAPIRCREITPEVLAEQIREVMDNERLAARATEVSLAMQGEDGVARAVEVIEGRFGPTRPSSK